jgi:hypothetical protein
MRTSTFVVQMEAGFAQVGGQAEIVTETTGYLITHNDDELKNYVRALADLINNADNLKAKSMACQALMASKYSWQKTIDDFSSTWFFLFGLNSNQVNDTNNIPTIHIVTVYQFNKNC